MFVPDDNFPIRAEDYLPDIAIDPTNGDIYVVRSDGLGTAIDKVAMAKSTDGGRHWSGPTVVSAGGPNVQGYNHHRSDPGRHGRPDLVRRPQATSRQVVFECQRVILAWTSCKNRPGCSLPSVGR
jgi:hypothetical protein